MKCTLAVIGVFVLTIAAQFSPNLAQDSDNNAQDTNNEAVFDNSVVDVNDASETVIVIKKKNGEVKTYSSKTEEGIPSEILARISAAETIDETPSDTFRTTSSSSTTPTPSTAKTTTSGSVRLIDPGIDARTEIGNYNRFMDKIFARMNAAIKQKKLDPMDLKLLPNGKDGQNGQKKNEKDDGKPSLKNHIVSNSGDGNVLILTDPSTPKPESTLPPVEAAVDDEEDYFPVIPPPPSNDEEDQDDISKVRGWLYGMSSLKRFGDVSIRIHESHRTIECPFALGPLELKVSKTLSKDGTKRTKSATATTDLMLGYMAMKIDRESGQANITKVIFDEPGGIDLNGSLKRRSDINHKQNGGGDKLPPYRLVLASRAALGIKKVARLVVSSQFHKEAKK